MCWNQKPTRRHVHERTYNTWWMEQSSSFVKHHEFLDVLSQPFPSIWKGKHAEQNSRKEDRRRACGSEKPRPASLISRNPPNVEQTSSFGSDASNVPENPQLDPKSVLGSTWKHVHDRHQHVLKRRRDTIRVKEVAGISSRVLKINLNGQGWTSTQCKSPTLCALTNSSRICDRNFVSVLIHSMRRPLYWQRWSHQFISGFQYQENLVAYGTTSLELKRLFDITQWLIVEQSFEILNVSAMISSYQVGESRGTCLGQIFDHSEANEKWKSQIKEFQRSDEYTELSGIFWESIGFEWKNFQDSHRLRFSDKSRKIWKLNKRNPEQLEGTILLVSMFNGIDWTLKGNSLDFISNSKQVSDYSKSTPCLHRPRKPTRRKPTGSQT